MVFMKITHNPKKCINCGNCVSLCPDLFKVDNDNIKLIKGELNSKTGNFERKIEKVDCAKDAAEICPVGAIKILSE
jgi:ferredoxin